MFIPFVSIIKAIVFQKAQQLLLFHPWLQFSRKEYPLNLLCNVKVIFTVIEEIFHFNRRFDGITKQEGKNLDQHEYLIWFRLCNIRFCDLPHPR